MQFLANENFPAPSIFILRENGIDVKSILEDLPGISDKEVVEIALLENRIILTFDRDYGELILRNQKKQSPAVIYFRNKGKEPQAAGIHLVNLQQSGQIDFTRSFTVIGPNSIRQRKY